MELYVQEPGTTLQKEGERVIARRDGITISEIPFAAIEHMRLVGSGVHISTPLLHACLEAGIPVSFLSSRGHFRGQLVPAADRGATLRQAQYAATLDLARTLPIARAVVAGKLRNQRFLLRRHGAHGDLVARQVRLMLAGAMRRAATAPNHDIVRGIEGAGARAYFVALGQMLPPCAAFRVRSRRPPRDLGNALLSYGYAVLLAECTQAVRACGLDPALGCLHMPHHDQPSLALDLMEEFRPLIVDAAVLDLTRHHRVSAGDGTPDGDGLRLSSRARVAMVGAIEARLGTRRAAERSEDPLTLRELLHRQARGLREALLDRAPAYLPLPLP